MIQFMFVIIKEFNLGNLPRYFDKLYEIEEPDIMQHIKDDRKELADQLRHLKLSQTSLNYWDLLQSELRSKENSLMCLKRKEI